MRRNTVLVATALALIPFALLVGRFWFTCDDAYISFRYARHLAEGRGLIFNPGEAPPVEGYSNLLWTVFLALPSALGLELAPVANAVSAACGAVLIALVASFLRRRLDLCGAGSIASAVFQATLPPMAIWATSGLETMPFALATFATFHNLCADPGRPRALPAGGAAVAATLLRADGLLWVAIVLAAALLASPGAARLRRAVAAAGAAAVLAAGAHLTWRYGYHGDWLPNTVRAKAGFSLEHLERGWGYLVSLLLAVPSIALVSVAAGAARGGQRGTVVLQSLLVLFASALYVVLVGGDFMAMGRFFVPALPFLALVFAAASMSWALPARLGFAAVAIGLNVVGCFDRLPVPYELRQHFHFRWNVPGARSEVGQWRFMRKHGVELADLGRALALHTAPGESMIRSAVGGPGYFTELVLFDRHGIVSPEVVRDGDPLESGSPGHDRHVQPSFFFDRRPTYYGAKLVEAGGPPGLGVEAQQLIAAGRLQPLRLPLPEGEGFPQGAELQLLRFRWD